MENVEHTPEPWYARNEWRGKAHIAVAGPQPDHDYQIAHLLNYPHAHSDARRIIACVNACAGLPIGALEKAAECASASRFGTMAAMYKTRLDEAVKSFETISALYRDWIENGYSDEQDPVGYLHDAAKMADVAIAKAKAPDFAIVENPKEG